MAETKERWLSGAVEGMPSLLQPVAHALLQAQDEVALAVTNFPDELLWTRPAGLASVGFHLQHIQGVLDRLFTYASHRQLDRAQLYALSNEGAPYQGHSTCNELLEALKDQVAVAIGFLKNTTESSLTEPRAVGRAQIPSTVIGLLFHAAEHTMRHTGQLLVTARIVLTASGDPLTN